MKNNINLPEGYFTEADIKEYRHLMSCVPLGGTIVELGCYKGRSICSVADIIKERNLKVFVVDIFTWTENEKTEEQKKITIEYEQEFRDNVALFGIFPVVMRMKTDEAYLYIADNIIDLILIDADHSYEAVFNDIKNWETKCKGTVAGHDYVWDHPGVIRAVDEIYGKVNVGINSSVWSKQK